MIGSTTNHMFVLGIFTTGNLMHVCIMLYMCTIHPFEEHKISSTKVLCSNHFFRKTYRSLIFNVILPIWKVICFLKRTKRKKCNKYFLLYYNIYRWRGNTLAYFAKMKVHLRYTVWCTISEKVLQSSCFFVFPVCTKSLEKVHKKSCLRILILLVLVFRKKCVVNFWKYWTFICLQSTISIKMNFFKCSFHRFL